MIPGENMAATKHGLESRNQKLQDVWISED